MGHPEQPDGSRATSALVVYGATVAAVAAALALRRLFDPVLGDHLPYATFFVAVVVAAWLGGLRPALLATLLGFLGALYLFVPPRGAVLGSTGPHLFGLALYFLVSLAVAGFGEAMWAARRRLAAQAERLRVTLASIGDAVLTTDAAGRVTHLNAVAEALTGWTNADAVGRPLDDVFRIVNEQTRRPVENPATRALRAGVIVGLANHTVLIARDGTERPIDDSAAPIRSGAGDVLGCVLVWRDISERKRREEALRDAAADLQRTLDTSATGLTRCSRELRYASANPAYGRLVGLPVEQIVGRPIVDVLGAAAWEAIRPHVERVLQGERVEYETEVPFAVSGSRHIRVVYTPDHDARGEVVGWFASVSDITDRKRGEEEAENSRQTLQALVERCPFGIYLVDADFRMARMNARSQDGAFANVRPLLGRPFDEVMRVLWPEPLATDLIRTFRHTLDTGEPYYSKDFVNPRADIDQVEAYEWELHRLTLPDGRHGVVCYYFDATKLRHAEQQLKDADRRKDEFLATLAHELRNPLAPLRNGLQVMKVATTDPAAVEQARAMMERQLGQMVHLIEDLMDLSRISRGKVQLRKDRVELALVVRQAVETSRPLIEERGHAFALDMPEEPLYVDGDETRLAQVFANLLNNAAKYTDRGGRIVLSVARRGEDVVVNVKDNGVGIPAAMLPKVFEMFTQVDRSLEKAQGGLGIGLSLVKQLVLMHGGSVEARSDGHGKGSEFVVTLPAVAAPAPEARPADAASAPAGKRRILVADDNVDAATSLALLLRLMGNEVRTAHDGAAAVEAAAAFRPDVALLDIGMPKLNGLDACRRIRQEPWGKSVVLVALTGWGQEDDRRQTREAGFDHHVVKPVDPAKLQQLLAALKATPA